MKQYIFVYIVDLDGTVCDSTKYAHFLSCKPKNYDAFWAGVPQYDPLPLLNDINSCRNVGVDVVFSTARDELTRKDTLEWLGRHLEAPVSDSDLYMRGSLDYRPDYLLKRDLLKIIKNRFGDDRIYCAFEDIKRVQDMYMEEGCVVYCPIKKNWLNQEQVFGDNLLEL